MSISEYRDSSLICALFYPLKFNVCPNIEQDKVQHLCLDWQNKDKKRACTPRCHVSITADRSRANKTCEYCIVIWPVGEYWLCPFPLQWKDQW